VPKGLGEPYWVRVTILYAIYSYIALVVGAIFGAFGFILFLNGIFDKTRGILVSLLGLKTQISDFSPGIGFLVFGSLLIILSKFSISESE